MFLIHEPVGHGRGHGCEEFFPSTSTAALLIACGTRERLSRRVTLSACVVAV